MLSYDNYCVNIVNNEWMRGLMEIQKTTPKSGLAFVGSTFVNDIRIAIQKESYFYIPGLEPEVL